MTHLASGVTRHVQHGIGPVPGGAPSRGEVREWDLSDCEDFGRAGLRGDLLGACYKRLVLSCSRLKLKGSRAVQQRPSPGGGGGGGGGG